ncbi:MAG: DUF4358 domain-containing protein [Oscillospiraceae bacterium]|nr:DUF4358 domain-containing protein [Oscillospiraceae bacterium]
MKFRRTVKTVIFAITAILFLASCGSASKSYTAYSPDQIAKAIITAQDGISALRPLMPEDDYFEEYLRNIYRFESDAVDSITAGAIRYAEGMAADEIAVFLLSDNASVKYVKDTLTEYKQQREYAFTGYAPEQAAILANGSVVNNGNYVALLICREPQIAEAVFTACFSDSPPVINEEKIISPPPVEKTPPLPEPTQRPASDPLHDAEEPPQNDIIVENIFDSDAVLKAWRSGDNTGLSEKSARVLEACLEITGAIIDENMNDFEKETAVNDWIVDWVDYDQEVHSNSPDASPDPDNDNPYGAIINKKAVCSGYSSTFQLLMDMLEIECITVKGSYTATGEEHAWNMVRIDGEWYCTDVTWNDPVGGRGTVAEKHRFLNVTSRYMRETKHLWDEASTPVAGE